MIRRRKSNLPKWRYEFDCRKCDNIREGARVETAITASRV